MTFDEQLSHTVDTLSGRLREEIARQLDSAAEEIAASAHAAREQATAEARSDAERVASDRLAAAVADAEARAYEYGKEEGDQLHTADVAARERLVASIRAIDAVHSLTDILDALAGAAAREAERVAVLLVRGEHLRGWLLIGFGSALALNEPLELPIEDSGIVADVVKTRSAVFGDITRPPRAPAFAALSQGRPHGAVPVAIAGEVVAVLYADQGETAVQSMLPSTLEVLTRHASRCLEALIAFKAARMFSEHPQVDEATSRQGPEAGAEDETAARRFARLLVSEIKMYHEDAVAAGRREGDLATRLGGEIARARVLYEQRVTPQVRRRADYFHDELVRTLADGDSSLLMESR